jgi:hypothetical protein
MNIKRALVCVVLASAFVHCTITAHAAVIIETPVCDGSYDLVSHDWQLDSVSLLAYNGQPGGYNVRAAIEFDLQSIPADAIINSAVFRIRYNGASGTHAETLKFCSYAGDGALSPSDFLATDQIGPLFEAFGPSADTFPFYHVPATAFVQSLVDNGSRYAGFTAQNVVWNQTAFYSHWAGPSYTPRLEIDYTVPVPEPATALLSLVGLVVVASYGWSRGGASATRFKTTGE